MFGRSLEETMGVETRLGGGFIPILLHRCVTFLRKHGVLHYANVLCVSWLVSCRPARSGYIPSSRPS